MIIMPGYCVAGTVGHKILNGTRKIEFKKGKPPVEVKMSVQYMSFSAHADAKGIMQLISYCEPRHVMLVHGEAAKMEFLKAKIKQEHKIDCFMPANGETATIPTPMVMKMSVSKKLLRKEEARFDAREDEIALKRPRLLHGVLVMMDNKLRIMDPDDACQELGLDKHTIRSTSTVLLKHVGPLAGAQERVFDLVKSMLQDTDYKPVIEDEASGTISVAETVLIKLEQSADDDTTKEIIVSWANRDEHVGTMLLHNLQSIGAH